jgi:hypothetical protein
MSPSGTKQTLPDARLMSSLGSNADINASDVDTSISYDGSTTAVRFAAPYPLKSRETAVNKSVGPIINGVRWTFSYTSFESSELEAVIDIEPVSAPNSLLTGKFENLNYRDPELPTGTRNK